MVDIYPQAGVRWDDGEEDEMLHHIQCGTTTHQVAVNSGRSHRAIILQLTSCYDENRFHVISDVVLNPNGHELERINNAWTNPEWDILIEEFVQGLPIDAMMARHDRTRAAIAYALATLLDRHFALIQINARGGEA